MTTITYLGIIIFLSLSLWIIYGATYRLYLSPIAKFPGPKLAALTLWYEFYFNVIRDGQWLWEIKRMHEEYGPIVRINPYELHIDDPEYYDELYAGNTKKREKYLWFARSTGSQGSSFETIGHDHHRIRRNAVNPFFSKRSIVAMEPLIKSKISLLSNIFHSHFANQAPVNLRVVFSSLTLDVISDYCYGEAFGALTDKRLAEIWSNTLSQVMSTTTIVMHLPIIPKILSCLPDKKTLSRLADEGNILIGAGGETTAQTLAVLFYHLLDNPKMISRIKDELGTLDEDITWKRLEKLPFLSAAITEALRLSGVTSRLPRIAPNEDMKFQQWTIPAGTPTSMSYYFLHHSPEIFPSPETFDPTRWISDSSSNGSTTGDASRKHRLDKYFVPFGKGTRNCLGINLAYAELFLTTAYILKRFDFELYGTTKKDVEIKRDHFVGAPAAGSKGIRVIVKDDKGE
ncbi:hypothetical protein SS1G_08659 [Sclerotinia sclerotiorum 1980 UF-70]|uniref:Cytochrome P450 n=1 Tax=Sclerotinia sclerotiorum (strain ATCC 18683 / 1980 / Ss-1) TaxID=665079 RepID=A7ETK3_SCLS1|nr:hypothetical protein SS1G_08659 [Sclerotinia sclerotiorum 1980 UF-70]EDN92795.1 hypothetical protein SS1G_08659 [Sclerotinia sclerotiorum 1980 UF-70]